MKKRRYQLSALIICILLCNLPSFAGAQDQKVKKRTARLSASYIQEYDTPARIVAILKVREKQYETLPGAPVKLISNTDTDQVVLDTVITNKDGEAIFAIHDYPGLYRDSSGVISVVVEFEGDSITKSADREVEFIQTRFEILFYQKDTVKMIELDAKEVVSESETRPIPDLDIRFSVRGLFSLLPFENAGTDSEGKAKAEFPVYMPGDTAGVLTIVASLDDHDRYGTVKASGSMNWARVVPLPDEQHRGLGDTDAPLWMVYTLIILLSAVWFHYLYVTWQVIKIKLVGKGVL